MHEQQLTVTSSWHDRHELDAKRAVKLYNNHGLPNRFARRHAISGDICKRVSSYGRRASPSSALESGGRATERFGA